MNLTVLNSGPHDVQKIFCNGRIALAMKNDTWYALNYRSQSPLNMRNREERSTWAHAQGLLVKDVENYVRRYNAQMRKEHNEGLLREARSLLEANGYTVTK